LQTTTKTSWSSCDLGLTGNDYEILTARDGFAALATAREMKPTVALLDVNMPELDGFEVTSALKTDPATKDIVVILFTARWHRTSRRATKSDDYIMKPFTLKTLQSRVIAALERAAHAAA